jgi:hypothetical protein
MKFTFQYFCYIKLNNIYQCGKPFFSNTRQNGEWTETSTRQYEIELTRQQIPNKQYSNVQQFILQILTSH